MSDYQTFLAERQRAIDIAAAEGLDTASITTGTPRSTVKKWCDDAGVTPMMFRTKWTEAQRAAAIEHAQRDGAPAAALAIGCTVKSVRDWCAVAGITPAPARQSKPKALGRPRTNIGKCSVDECPSEATRRGMCHAHYQRAWRKSTAKKRVATLQVVPDLTAPTFVSPCHDQPIIDVTEPEQVTRGIQRQVGTCPTCGSTWRRTITVMPEPTPIRYRTDLRTERDDRTA